MSQNRFHATDQQTLIQKAEKLSHSLFANEIPSARLHAKILKLDELYMHILANDRKKLLKEYNEAKYANQQKSTLPLYKILVDRQPLLDIMKRLLSYQTVEDEDNEVAAKIDLPESKHIQDYIKLLKACSDYANSIKKHLLRMKVEFGAQYLKALGNRSARDLGKTEFHVPEPVAMVHDKLTSIVADMDLNDVLDLYRDVMEIMKKYPAAEWQSSSVCHEKYLKLLTSIKFISPPSAVTMMFKSTLAVSGELYISGHKVLSKSNLKNRY